MSTPAEKLPRRRRQVNREALARRQGLGDVLRLTEGITQGELATILREAAEQAQQMVMFGLRGTVGQAAIAQLNAATRGLDELSVRMWARINAQVQNGIRDAANLAADQQLIREFQMGLPAGVIQQISEGLHFNALQGAADIISRRTHGFTLSRRVYNNSQATVLQVGKVVERGLARQLSARQIAGQVREFISPTTPGGTSFAAMRLARTEINNAHHDTTISLSKERPWVQGFQWKLSGSHPHADECDELAHEDHANMGEGVFPKGEVPSKPHPQCLCYLLIAQVPEQEFIQQLTTGQYDAFLRSQGANV